MHKIESKPPKRGRPSLGLSFRIFLTVSLLISSSLTGCSSGRDDVETVDYTPLLRDDWEISTPAEQGLDPRLVAELYSNAANLETLYSLLVIKDGRLVAEKYFNNGTVGQKTNTQSVTKSFTSALVGIALEQGCLSSVDQKMLEFFLELVNQINDKRKEQITIRDLLQMRAGFPWEESDPALWEALWKGEYVPLVVHFPLISDPGTEHHYSNLTADWLGIIVARACGSDLKSFASEYLFNKIGSEVGVWAQDVDGYYIGHGELHLTARDMAKFGLLYLNDGLYHTEQIIPADWVSDSLQTYSDDAWTIKVGRNFTDIGYGYQWWSVRAGDQRFHFAWGHGGQQIAILDKLEMVIVVTADPLYGQTGDGPWRHEKANLELVGNFISTLPSE